MLRRLSDKSPRVRCAVRTLESAAWVQRRGERAERQIPVALVTFWSIIQSRHLVHIEDRLQVSYLVCRSVLMTPAAGGCVAFSGGFPDAPFGEATGDGFIKGLCFN